MELILLENVGKLGSLGEKVTVRRGYGRNYLVPQGKAVPATAENMVEFEARRAEYESRAKAQLAGAEGRKAQFEDASVTIAANASTEGRLFGSVGAREIADAFTAKGLALEGSEVVLLDGAFRNTGTYEVQVALHADINVLVTVEVVAI